MSSESQVRSLLDVVTFILERLSPSEAFDENIFSDYFRKHHDIVDSRYQAPCHPEAIIIPESDAFQDDINNQEEKDSAEPNNSDNEDEIKMTTNEKAIVIQEMHAFGDDDLEEDSDNDDDDLFHCKDLSIEEFDKGSTRSARKEPIEVKVVSATIVNRKEYCDFVEFENECFEEEPLSLEYDQNLKKGIGNENESSEVMINKFFVEERSMESDEGKLQSEEELREMHRDYAPKDFPHKTIESLDTAVSKELKDRKVNLNKIRTGKKLSRKKKSKVELRGKIEKERFKCHICGKEGLIANQLLIHLKKKHLPNLSNDECPLCSFKGSWIEQGRETKSVERHIQTMHSQMECICHICDKACKGPMKLKSHIYQQHILGKNFHCKTCNRVFTTQRNLAKHELKHTVKEKNIPCDECDKKFLTIYTLNMHKYNCHKPKNFLCSQCDFVTNNKCKLNQHSVVHSEERPFQCHSCAKSFKTKIDLDKHEFYHTGIRKEECLVCGKKFKTKSALKQHQKYHEGHYDSYCHPCDKKFVQEYNYKVHVKKHHAGEHLP